MSERIEVSRDVAASPEAVFDLVTDIHRLSEWSPEIVGCEWCDDATGPAVGATYDGHNRGTVDPSKTWTTQARITEFERPTTYTFECRSRDFHYATWGYRIEPTDDGCRVTEWTEDLRPEAALVRSVSISGVEDRAAYNRESMATTLDRLAAVVED